MTEHGRVENDDEIDLKELFLTLWQGKYLICLISFLAVVLASVYLHRAERKYSVEIVLKPVIEDSGGGPNLSGFSGLASLAGVSLPTSSSSDFVTYQKLIFSEEVADRVSSNTELLISLFGAEWNSTDKIFESPSVGLLGGLMQVVTSTLTGVTKGEYIEPNPKRLSMLMDAIFNLSTDSKTGFVSISTETSYPDLMVSLITSAAQETDNLLKERFFATAEETLEFYQQKLLTSRSPEHREALAKLISAEDQKLMLASKGRNFVAEPLTMPSISLYPTSPKSSLVLALGFVLGIFMGAAIVLLRHAMRTPKVN